MTVGILLPEKRIQNILCSTDDTRKSLKGLRPEAKNVVLARKEMRRDDHVYLSLIFSQYNFRDIFLNKGNMCTSVSIIHYQAKNV